jgi:hypothetical protein
VGIGWRQAGTQVEAGRGEDPVEGGESRLALRTLVGGDRRLGRAGTGRQLALGDAGSQAGIGDQGPRRLGPLLPSLHGKRISRIVDRPGSLFLAARSVVALSPVALGRPSCRPVEPCRSRRAGRGRGRGELAAQFGHGRLQISTASESGGNVAVEAVATGSGVFLCSGGAFFGGFGSPGGSGERRLELTEASGELAGAGKPRALGEPGALGRLALGVRRVDALPAHQRSARSPQGLT